MIGRRIGRYEILGEIGRGGMGVVYKATQTSLNRTVAIKMLPPMMAVSEEYLSRFQREAETLARLAHPNIVHIYDVDELDGSHFIIMEYVGGASLAKLLRKQGRLSPSLARDVTAAVAAGLSAAHEQGIVHRDVKPDNILFTLNGLPKLTDFGIAHMRDTRFKTQTGTTLGTPSYLSPEQAQGKAIGAQSDIYSLGTCLYEMLAGRVPFEGAQPVAVALMHLKDAPEPLSELVPEASPEICALVHRCLEKKPEDRFADMKELQQALQALALADPPGIALQDAFAASGSKPTEAGCPECGTALLPEFLTCPGCGLAIRRRCEACGELFDALASECPECRAPARTPTPVPPPAPQSQGTEPLQAPDGAGPVGPVPRDSTTPSFVPPPEPTDPRESGPSVSEVPSGAPEESPEGASQGARAERASRELVRPEEAPAGDPSPEITSAPAVLPKSGPAQVVPPEPGPEQRRTVKLPESGSGPAGGHEQEPAAHAVRKAGHGVASVAGEGARLVREGAQVIAGGVADAAASVPHPSQRKIRRAVDAVVPERGAPERKRMLAGLGLVAVALVFLLVWAFWPKTDAGGRQPDTASNVPTSAPRTTAADELAQQQKPAVPVSPEQADAIRRAAGGESEEGNGSGDGSESESESTPGQKDSDGAPSEGLKPGKMRSTPPVKEVFDEITARRQIANLVERQRTATERGDLQAVLKDAAPAVVAEWQPILAQLFADFTNLQSRVSNLQIEFDDARHAWATFTVDLSGTHRSTGEHIRESDEAEWLLERVGSSRWVITEAQ